MQLTINSHDVTSYIGYQGIARKRRDIKQEVTTFDGKRHKLVKAKKIDLDVTLIAATSETLNGILGYLTDHNEVTWSDPELGTQTFDMSVEEPSFSLLAKAGTTEYWHQLTLSFKEY